MIEVGLTVYACTSEAGFDASEFMGHVWLQVNPRDNVLLLEVFDLNRVVSAIIQVDCALLCVRSA